MSLGCYADNDEIDLAQLKPGTVFYEIPSNYSYYEGKRACRCTSCHAKIKPNNIIAAFNRFKVANHAVDLAIYSDGLIPYAPYRLCERCADLWFSLDELGFDSDPTDNQMDNAKEAASYNADDEGDL